MAAQTQALVTTRQTRNRAFFGLLDANGWGWASLKAVFWFVLLIFFLGYVPDRAYYFTVNKTIDLGILAWSPINFCAPGNRTLPCPAPVGAVVPWDQSPELINLPEPRTDGTVVQSGTTILYVGGTDGTTPSAETFLAKSAGVGNLETKGGAEPAWTAGPKLPEPRSDAAILYSGGSIYVIGGLGEDGKPTTSVFVLKPDSTTGALGDWKTAEDAKLDLTLPEPRAGAVAIAGTDGIYLVGGTNGSAPTATILKSSFDPKSGSPTKWKEQPGKLYTAVTDASVSLIGNYVWVYGGTTAEGKPTATVQRGELGTGTDATNIVRFGVRGGSTDLPGPRTNMASFAANGNLYAIGGDDGSGPTKTLYWAVPSATGDLPEWKHLDVSDLPQGNVGGAPVVLGPDAVIIGGSNGTDVAKGSLRANIAPEAPFFQLGLVGATVPALKIDGEIGQQLGYLNANTIGIVNFAIFVIIGVALAHRPQIAAWRDRRRRDKEIRSRA
jgi:hypothetical protein